MNGFYPEGWQKNELEPQFTRQFLEESLTSEKVLESTVLMCDAYHNLIIDLKVMRGVIPRSEGAIGIEEGLTRDIALISRVGKKVCFCVEDISEDQNGKPYALLSRKRAQEKCRRHIQNEMSAGDVINAKITHLESFGAFCDIGCGVIALLPIDAISVSRIGHPMDRFFVGEEIRAVIKNVASDSKITLSHKELLGTWEENAELFSPGQTVTGVIRSIENYGIFVEIAPNLAGLAEPKENVKVGSRASVYIKSIIKEKMKIKLIIIDSFENGYSPEIKYFNTSEHIDDWEYSPSVCEKRIFTRFCG